jgi:16S rRNA (uracil1498-N3)-methyltransferase
MTRRRWIADSWDEHTAVLTGDHAAHLSRVLRARVGQQFEIVAGEQVRLGTIESVTDDRVVFRLGDLIDAASALPI